MRFDFNLVSEVPAQGFPICGLIALGRIACSIYRDGFVKAEMIVGDWLTNSLFDKLSNGLLAQKWTQGRH